MYSSWYFCKLVFFSPWNASIGQKAGCSAKPEWTDLGKRSSWNLGNLTLPDHAGALARSLALLAPLCSEAFAYVIQVISGLLDRLCSVFSTSFALNLHSSSAWAAGVWYPAEESLSEKPRCRDPRFETCLHLAVIHAEPDSALIYKPQQISGCKQIQGYSTKNVQLFTDISKTNEENRGYNISV